MKSEDVCFWAGKLQQTQIVCWKAEIFLCQQKSIQSTLVFPVVMYGCDSWTVKKAECRRTGRKPKNWCLRTGVLEKTPESPFDSKEIKPVNVKRDQPWIFTGRTDVEVETPIFWPPNVKSQLNGKDPDAGKDWGEIRGWDGWKASLTQWTWVSANSGR